MRAVLHFRTLKVHEFGFASSLRSNPEVCSNEAVTPFEASDPDLIVNIWNVSFPHKKIYPTGAAYSGRLSFTGRAAELSALTSAILSSFNSYSKGGMA